MLDLIQWQDQVGNTGVFLWAFLFTGHPMKSKIRLVLCLSLCVPMTLARSSVAQAPPSPPQKPPDHSEGKLPAFLAAAKPLQMDPKDDELRKLLKARYNEALGELKDFYKTNELASEYGVTRRGDPDDLYRPWQRLVQAGLEVYDKPADKVGLLAQYLEVTKRVEKIEQARYDNGRIRIGDVHRARYERLDTEIRLLRAKREADKGKDK